MARPPHNGMIRGHYTWSVSRRIIRSGEGHDQDARFLAIDVVARHRHWLVDDPLDLWTGGVNVAISSVETLPPAF